MTRAVTANVLSRLDRAAARRCLDAALDLDPDVVGLQEWGPTRLPLLRDSGAVRLAGTPVVVPGGGRFTWAAGPLGDCVVGLRSERFRVRRCRSVRLGGPRRADRGVRRVGVLPPRWVVVVEADDLVERERVGVVGFHLVPGAQRSGRYREDRPRTSTQHARETAALAHVVTDLRSRCATVWALGDSNFHGLQLPGLTSAWDDVPGSVGTLGSYRRIDDVFGVGPPQRVEMFVTESDHRMVMAERG